MNLRDRTLAALQAGLRRDGYYTEISNWYEAGGVEHVDITVGVDGQCIGQLQLTVKDNGRLVERAATTPELERKGLSIFTRRPSRSKNREPKGAVRQVSGDCEICGAGPEDDCYAGLHG